MFSKEYLNQWQKVIVDELKNNGINNIIALGAANPEKWMDADVKEIPASIFWGWLVNRKDSDVSGLEREFYMENKKAQTDIEMFVEEAVYEYLQYLDEADLVEEI